MSRSILTRRRGGFLALLALLAGLALATVLAAGGPGTGPSSSAAPQGQGSFHSHAVAVPAAPTNTQIGTEAKSEGKSEAAAFQDEMRRLWEDHVTWTRLAIVTFADGSAGFDATAARLLRNQDDIGDAIKPYYGDAAGEQLAALLTDHIEVAVELLQAASAGDDAAFEEARIAWYANADDIADLLAQVNPRHWPQDTMRAAMRGHLDQTLAEASHELTGQYEASVADYDEIHHHILGMADVLTSGIVRAFPHRFH